VPVLVLCEDHALTHDAPIHGPEDLGPGPWTHHRRASRRPCSASTRRKTTSWRRIGRVRSPTTPIKTDATAREHEEVAGVLIPTEHVHDEGWSTALRALGRARDLECRIVDATTMTVRLYKKRRRRVPLRTCWDSSGARPSAGSSLAGATAAGKGSTASARSAGSTVTRRRKSPADQWLKDNGRRLGGHISSAWWSQ
jgi:hypothetical protein